MVPLWVPVACLRKALLSPDVSFLSSHVSCSGVAQSRWRVGFNLTLRFCHLNGVNISRRIQEGEFSGKKQGDAVISQDSIWEGAGDQHSKGQGLGGCFRDSVPVVRFLGQGVFEEAVGEAEYERSLHADTLWQSGGQRWGVWHGQEALTAGRSQMLPRL